MRFVSRAGTGLRAPTRRTRLVLPRPLVTIHYEAGPALGAYPHERCPAMVRGVQAFHMNGRGWTDIAYNAMTCRHGVTYEGRGLGVRSAANGTNVGNGSAFAVCAMLGVGDTPTDDMLQGLADAAEWLAGEGTAINGHRDWKPTACPGDPLYGHLGTVREIIRAGDTDPNVPAMFTEEDDEVRPDTIVDAVPYIGGGTWRLQADGGIFAEQGAPYWGGMGGTDLSAPCVKLVTSLDGKAYYLVAEDYGIFGPFDSDTKRRRRSKHDEFRPVRAVMDDYHRGVHRCVGAGIVPTYKRARGPWLVQVSNRGEAYAIRAA